MLSKRRYIAISLLSLVLFFAGTFVANLVLNTRSDWTDSFWLALNMGLLAVVVLGVVYLKTRRQRP
jgi:uncharacterized protein (DUF983 family)